MDKDITDCVRFGNSDDESLPLTQCVCGKKFGMWHTVISIYRDDPWECSCGRKLYFKNSVSVYEIT